MTTNKTLRDDQFELYDLEVEVESITGNCTCNMKVGDKFFMKGGKLSLPADKDFCLYAIQASIPLLPTKQRINHPADWMETDSHVICPDPVCQLIMRIDRTNKRVLNHDDVSPVSMDNID
jgi:uncharacterized repeat protein (TIGR04076 family)